MWPETGKIFPNECLAQADDDHLVAILVQVEKMRWELQQEVFRRGRDCEALLTQRLKEFFFIPEKYELGEKLLTRTETIDLEGD